MNNYCLGYNESYSDFFKRFYVIVRLDITEFIVFSFFSYCQLSERDKYAIIKMYVSDSCNEFIILIIMLYFNNQQQKQKQPNQHQQEETIK